MVDQSALYCFICQRAKEREARLSGCPHTFCYDCIKEWMNQRSSTERHMPQCPVCSSNFDRVVADGRILTWTSRGGWGSEIREHIFFGWNESGFDYYPSNGRRWGD